MQEQMLKAATEITVAVIQSTRVIPDAKTWEQYASDLFKAVYKAVEEATGVRSSRQPAVVG